MNMTSNKNESKKFKVCLISMTPVGGFKSFLENIVQRLSDTNFEVTILSLSKNNDIDIPYARKRVFELDDYSNCEALTVGERLKNLVERFLFRMKGKHTDKEILKHNLYNSQLKAISRAKSCAGKVDLSEYDCVISAEEVTCNYFLAYSVIAKRKIGYIHPDYNNVPYNRRIEKTALSRLDYICATSKANAESIRKAIPKLKNKVVGVPNPIDIKTILQKSDESIKEAFNSDVVNLITVCRLDNTYKALDRLVSVAQKLKDGGDKFIWRVVGDGEYNDTMRSFIKEHQLQDCVIMLGAKDNPIPYVKHSDLFVLQSYSEGYPMSVLEAMAVDTPVLVTDYPSSSEQVDNGMTGFIVSNNFDSVYEKIHYLINHKDELHQIEINLQDMDKSRLYNIDNLLDIME